MESRTRERHTRVVSANLRASARSSTKGFTVSSLSRSPETFRVSCRISVLSQFHLPMKELKNSPVHYHLKIINSGSRYHIVYSNAYYKRHDRSSYPFYNFNPIALRLRVYQDHLLRQCNRGPDYLTYVLSVPPPWGRGPFPTHPVPF